MTRCLILMFLRVYQKIFSFDHGSLRIFAPYGRCKFWPTCSQYGQAAILRYGVWKGGWRIVRRLLRCHPWSVGGVEELL